MFQTDNKLKTKNLQEIMIFLHRAIKTFALIDADKVFNSICKTFETSFLAFCFDVSLISRFVPEIS